jgi:hypothetical protein
VLTRLLSVPRLLLLQLLGRMQWYVVLNSYASMPPLLLQLLCCLKEHLELGPLPALTCLLPAPIMLLQLLLICRHQGH